MALNMDGLGENQNDDRIGGSPWQERSVLKEIITYLWSQNAERR